MFRACGEAWVEDEPLLAEILHICALPMTEEAEGQGSRGAQRLLSYWHYHWAVIWSNPSERSEVAEQAQIWSDCILKHSGL